MVVLKGVVFVMGFPCPVGGCRLLVLLLGTHSVVLLVVWDKGLPCWLFGEPLMVCVMGWLEEFEDVGSEVFEVCGVRV